MAIVVDKKLRYERVAKRPGRAFDSVAIRERDRSEIENLEKGGPIVAADYYVLNNGSVSNVEARLDEILKEIQFWVNTVQSAPKTTKTKRSATFSSSLL